MIPLSKFKSILARTLQVYAGGNKCEAAPMYKSSLQEYGFKTLEPRLSIADSSLLTTMPVNSVFIRESG